LLRNGLVVLGNHLAGTTTYSMNEEQEVKVLRALDAFVFDEPDEMLREHAFWSVQQSRHAEAALILRRAQLDHSLSCISNTFESFSN
jgi:hypothetical protein